MIIVRLECNTRAIAASQIPINAPTNYNHNPQITPQQDLIEMNQSLNSYMTKEGTYFH